MVEAGLPLELDEVWNWEQINYGYFHFDNIGVASLSIFRVLTLEGWTPVMYTYLDCSGIVSGIFFPLVVVVGSFFML